MYFWVLGSSGMLGSAICKELERRKISYLGTNRYLADVTSFSSLNHLITTHPFTHIVNCAAYTQVDQAQIEKEKAFQINAIGPEILGQLSFQNSVKIIHFSTDYVFSGQKKEPYAESDFSDPINVYGKTKREGEKRLLKENPDALIIRISWAFGLEGENFVSKILKLMRKEKKLFVVSDQVGSPTFCRDAAKTLFDLLSFSGTIHFANHGALSWFEFARGIHKKAIKKNMNIKTTEILPVQSSFYKTKAKRPPYSVLETKKIEKILGEKPRTWESALDEYFSETFSV